MTKQQFFSQYPDVIAWIKNELKPANSNIFEETYLKYFISEYVSGPAQYASLTKNYETMLKFWIEKKLEAMEADEATRQIIKQDLINKSAMNFFDALLNGFKIVGKKIYYVGEAAVNAFSSPLMWALLGVGLIFYLKR